jgi:hypothetical protein
MCFWLLSVKSPGQACRPSAVDLGLSRSLARATP